MEKKLFVRHSVIRNSMIVLLIVWLTVFSALADTNPNDDTNAAAGIATSAGTPQLGTSTLVGMQPEKLNQPVDGSPSQAAGQYFPAPIDNEKIELEESGPSDAEVYFNKEPNTSGAGRRKADDVELNLKQLGYDFFIKGQGFQPDTLAQVGPEYVLGPGDTLRIDVWGPIEGNYLVTVDRNGEIVIPKVGVINLWGQTLEQSTGTIRKQIGKYFSKFELNVTMGTLRSIQVYVVGEIRSPGAYQVSALSTVISLLSEAGGPTKTGSLRNIQLMRNGQLVSTFDLYDFFLHGSRVHDSRLQSGDTLFVPIVGPLVAVAGNVRRPAIYELKGNETIEQALDLAGGLYPTAYLQKIELDRIQNHQLTTIFDLNINQDDPRKNALDMVLQDHDRIRVAPIAITGGYVRLVGYVMRPGEYQLRPGMRISDLILPFDNLLPEYFPDMAQIIRMTSPEYRQKMLTINLRKALLGDPTHNLILQEYDTVRLFSLSQMQELPEVVISGAVLKPGNYRLYDNMTIKDLITLAGNTKRNAFLGEAEITRYVSSDRSTVTKRFLIDIKKALQGDPEHDLALQVNDHLFIRSIPDSADRETIQLIGEVFFPGTYAIEKGEKLASLIQRAGGFTDKAYLRGAIFTRESLKKTQRAQAERLIAEQEQEILRTSAAIASGAMSEEDVTGATTMMQSRKALLEKLKEVPVTGRMVIRLTEDLANFVASPDNIELIGGDTLIIPFNPKTVTVLGQVYTPVSMIYNVGQTVEYYLDKVGGPKDNADTSEIYVVRADGSVFSKQQAGLNLSWDHVNNQWQTGGFYSEVLYPGDVVLVPEKVMHINWMKEIRDITTILYQITLGAAVVLSL